MIEQRCHETAEQRPSMFGFSAELSALFSMSHGSPLAFFLSTPTSFLHWSTAMSPILCRATAPFLPRFL
jgi:hypothetical protein